MGEPEVGPGTEDFSALVRRPAAPRGKRGLGGEEGTLDFEETEPRDAAEFEACEGLMTATVRPRSR